MWILRDKQRFQVFLAMGTSNADRRREDVLCMDPFVQFPQVQRP